VKHSILLTTCNHSFTSCSLSIVNQIWLHVVKCNAYNTKCSQPMDITFKKLKVVILGTSSSKSLRSLLVFRASYVHLDLELPPSFIQTLSSSRVAVEGKSSDMSVYPILSTLKIHRIILCKCQKNYQKTWIGFLPRRLKFSSKHHHLK